MKRVLRNRPGRSLGFSLQCNPGEQQQAASCRGAGQRDVLVHTCKCGLTWVVGVVADSTCIFGCCKKQQQQIVGCRCVTRLSSVHPCPAHHASPHPHADPMLLRRLPLL
jgi:hypothetical protein